MDKTKRYVNKKGQIETRQTSVNMTNKRRQINKSEDKLEKAKAKELTKNRRKNDEWRKGGVVWCGRIQNKKQKPENNNDKTTTIEHNINGKNMTRQNLTDTKEYNKSTIKKTI